MAADKPMKLYKLLSGSITRYEGAEDKEGARKVVTYEANGGAAGNQVWLTEKEVAAVGLNKLEEVHGAVRNDQSTDKIAAPPVATSLTGAPAEDGDASDDGGGVDVGDAMAATPATSTSGVSTNLAVNPAVARVLAKKAADSK